MAVVTLPIKKVAHDSSLLGTSPPSILYFGDFLFICHNTVEALLSSELPRLLPGAVAHASDLSNGQVQAGELL